MTSQHFGSNFFSFRLKKWRNRNSQGRQKQNGTKKSLNYFPLFFSFFFLYFPQTLYVWFEGATLLDCLTFFPVEENYCSAATLNLLRRARAVTALPSALRVEGSIWTHLSQGNCEVQTISFSIPAYSSNLSFTTLAKKQW